MGDKQAFASYAFFLSRVERHEEAKYYRENMQYANGSQVMDGKYF